MKFLRVLINSFLSGLFFSSLLALLVYNLNINSSFKLSFFFPITAYLMATYGLLVMLLCFAIFFILQFFLGKKIQIAYVSPSFLLISFSFLIFFFLVIFWENYKYFLSFFDPHVRTLLKNQLMGLFPLAVGGLLLFYGFHYYQKKASFFLAYFLIFGGVLTFVFFQRVRYPAPVLPIKLGTLEAKKIDKKVIILGLEGLSLDFIVPLISERKLPNFSWLSERGSWGRLENFSPNEPVVLNNSFNTGKYPAKHRQISDFNYQILNIKEKIEVVPRFILFKQLTRIGLLKLTPKAPSLQIKDIWKILEENHSTFLKKELALKEEPKETNPKAEKTFSLFFKDLQADPNSVFALVRKAFFRDSETEEKAFQEKNQAQPQFYYLLLDGLNVAETYFYKFSFPYFFGNIAQEQITKYGPVIEKYYEFYDQILGKYLASLKEDELLIVYSPHGIEILPLWKRFVEWILGNSAVSAYHEHAPDGVVFFYGKGVSRGKTLEGMRLIDIIPTLLYYLGLPVGKDMDGVVQSQIFVKEFTEENPVFPISSYEEVQIKK
jgi:hypothetical protein